MIGPHRKIVWTCLVASALTLALGWFMGGPPEPQPWSTEAIDEALEELEEGRSYDLLAELQELFPYRESESDANIESRAWIIEQFREAGVDDVREDAGIGTDAFVNVVAELPGAEECVVVLAAHHDVVPGAPGAIDDGGAVAVLLEVARVVAQIELKGCGLRLISFDGEELGLYGSKLYVGSLPPAEKERIRAMIAVELVGWHRDKLVVQTIPHGFAFSAEGIVPAFLPATVRLAGDVAEVPVGLGDPWVSWFYQGAIRELSVNTGSDAGAFVERGIPALTLTGSALTGFYDAYHLPADDMHQVDSAKLDEAAQVVLVSALMLSALPDSSCSAEFGHAYLVVGSRTVERGFLFLAMVFLGLAALLTAAKSKNRFRIHQRGSLAALGLATGLLGATGSVMGFMTGVPLIAGLVMSSMWKRGRTVIRLLAFSPLAVQAVFVFVGSVAFGASWHGSSVDLVLLSIVVLAGFGFILDGIGLPVRREKAPVEAG